MDPLSAELKKLAQMSMVKKRKQSFAGGIDAFEHSIEANLVSSVPTQSEYAQPGEDTMEHVDCQAINDDHFKQSFAEGIDAYEHPVEADLTQCLILTVPTHSEPSEDTGKLHINRQSINDDYFKQSFAEGIDAYELSVESELILTEPTHPEPSKDTVEHINCQPTNDELQIDSESSDTNTSGGNAEQLPATPAGILSTVVSSREAVDESGHGTWPRKRLLASVRFTDQADCDMVRQKENGSRLAAASSIEWGNVTDNGYIDYAGTSQKSTGASIEDDLVIPNWRKETPLPVLGNENMSWKERQAKLQDALEWLRNEIGEMKKQDQLLMCQFIQLRSDIHTLKFTSNRRKTKTNATGSCEDLIENEQLRPNNMATSMIKFQSTMTLDRHRGHDRSPHQHMHDDDEDEDDDDDDDDEDEDDEDNDERTLLEPEYLPEFRTRTMSLLPPVQARRMARMRTTRNKSFSAGTDENTDRGLTDVLE